MSADISAVLIMVAAVVGGFILLFWVLPWMIDHRPQEPDHAAPSIPYPVDEAHLVMQDHLDCDATSCEARAHAVRVLREAGRMVPARDDR
ncbi:hypothetical protein [Nocardia araoensis]|uniref:hypothetical protein n=1 Tax=Nocardia araoensis TaxID=228600 RepID=UPI0005848653|nr:hypothetical protein [Nocardia araoensis]